MCVIIVKPLGETIPMNIIKKCWAKNPDGAGIAFGDGENVHIRKGFMTLDSFLDFLANLKLTEVDAILHFRISTSGGINPGMTHPFPISDNVDELTATDIITPVAVVHNGIIPTAPQPGLSDTATYIAETMLSRYKKNPKFYDGYRNRIVMLNEIRSKMALLDKDYFYILGEFYKRDGLLFSNLYWDTPDTPPKYPTAITNFSGREA